MGTQIANPRVIQLAAANLIAARDDVKAGKTLQMSIDDRFLRLFAAILLQTPEFWQGVELLAQGDMTILD